MTSTNRHTVKGDSPMFPEDATILNQVNETHTPDGRDVNARSILDIVEVVFRRALTRDAIGPHELDSMVETMRDTVVDGNGLAEALAFIIQKVSREITSKCGEADAHGTTMSLLQILSKYSWDAKVVITLAALAINYAEFWLIAQLYLTHPLAKSVVVLKQLPDLSEPSSALKSRFEALTSLINAMVDVTKGVIEFSQMPSLPISMTNVPTAAYWTIRSVVACLSEISSFTGMSLDDGSSTRTTTESLELSSMVLKERDIHDHLMQQLALCYQQIDEKKHTDAFDDLVLLFDLPQHDNIRILKHLILPKDDIQPLYQGSTKKRVHIDALKRKTVLLLISDLDVSDEEIFFLNSFYEAYRSKPELDYEIVWIPIVDADHSINWNEEHQQKFEKLQSMMSWYTIHNPKLLDPAAMRYIKEVWQFQKRAVLVVLDPHGKVVSQNALDMILIWGKDAYPFTAMKELSLWREETWNFKLLMGNLNPGLYEWILKHAYLCVYGGQDMDWIRRFTTTIKQIAHLEEMRIEPFYVGKSNAMKRLEKISETMDEERLKGYQSTPISCWYFWKRLECILYSKMKLGVNIERDRVIQEVLTLLSYDESDKGWAIIWKDDEMARAKGDIMLKSLSSFKEWEENAKINGFVPALREHLKLQTPHHCTRVTFPRVQGGILAKVVCAECGRAMETYVTYRCCPN